MNLARSLRIRNRNRYRNRKKNYKTSRRISKSGIRNSIRRSFSVFRTRFRLFMGVIADGRIVTSKLHDS